MKFQLSHLRKRLGLLFSSFFLSFVLLAAYFFFQEEHGWVCIVFFFFVGGERRVISTLIRAFFFFFLRTSNLSLSIRRLMYVAVIISMQYFLFLTANLDAVWITTFFRTKNWLIE